MQQEDTELFFACIGEIRRDITTIEFFMRCCIMKKDGDGKYFQKPPYFKGKRYEIVPKSFTLRYFSDVVKQFNKYFPHLKIPEELVALRNAMAHGMISSINGDVMSTLLKFSSDGKEVDFSLPMDMNTLIQLRQSLKEYRRWISQEI